MGIGDIGSKISNSDRDRLKSTRNPPEFEEGFENDVIDDNCFDSLFDDISIPSGNDTGSSDTADSLFSSFEDFKPNTNTSSSLNIGNTQQQQPEKEDIVDKALKVLEEVSVVGGKEALEIFKDIRNRTVDDLGFLGSRSIKVGLAVAFLGIPLGLIGIASGVNSLSIWNIPLKVCLTGITISGLGLICLGVSAVYLETADRQEEITLDSIPDIQQDNGIDLSEFESYVEDYEEDIFDYEEDTLEDYEDYEDTVDEPFNYFETETTADTKEEVDYKEKEESLPKNVPMLGREFLYNTFKGYFPTNTVGFSKVEKIDSDSDKFYNIETLCMKALASASKLEFEETAKKSELISLEETYYTYILRLKRIRGLNKLDDIEREMVAYFRENSEDTSVSCTADLEGDVYKLVINKGVSALVTIGDCLTLPEVERYIKDTSKYIPIIAGITENGQPVLTDAKDYDTMLIAGKPRSGKSWYVLELIWTMMVFNSPEDIQFLFIDPKESNLFKTLSLMPHVCGIHNDDNILAIFKDLIENEAPRRKKLLADHRCENIWDLRKKGIKLPVIYILIDEVMTVVSNLGSSEKEFMSLIKVIVTQLPSQGIRLIMVPHRSQGVVDKTIRTNIGFTSAVRADTEVVLETLDIKKWTKPLLNAGDIALKMQGVGKELFVRGLAVTPTDTENTEHIMSVARSFYKMGVEIPDMTNIGLGYNRDIDKIKAELGVTEGSKVQFDINDLDDIEMD